VALDAYDDESEALTAASLERACREIEEAWQLARRARSCTWPTSNASWNGCAARSATPNTRSSYLGICPTGTPGARQVGHPSVLPPRLCGGGALRRQDRRSDRTDHPRPGTETSEHPLATTAVPAILESVRDLHPDPRC